MPLKLTKRRRIPSRPRAAAPPGAPPKILSVPYHIQEQNNWCWAACCQMVFEFYGENGVHQCDMATYQFGANCCANPTSKTCDAGNWPENIYPHWKFSCTRLEKQISLAALKAEIDYGRPVEVYFAWHGSPNAHVAIVRGYYDNGDVEVHDPWRDYGSRPVSFAKLQSAYGLGAWAKTWINLRK